MLAFDLILATRRPAMTGVERYGVQLFEAVRKRAPDAVAYVRDPSAFSDKTGLIVVDDIARSWLSLPWRIKRDGLCPDAVIFPTAPASPLFKFSDARLRRIMHDAFPWTRGGAMKLTGRLLFRDVERFMAARYDRLLATTEPVADELRALLGRSDIEAVGNAPGIDLEEVAPRPVDGAPEKFVLAVGTIEPRKNYRRIIELAEHAPAGAPPIMVVGRPGWGDAVAEMEAATGRMPERLIWRNDLTDDGALIWLYRNAAGFLSLSHAEGFNMPLVEAGMFGLPVVCSDLPIHRLVAPPWARFVTDDDAPGIIWSLLSAADLPPESAFMQYRRCYSWDRVAERLLAVT